MKDIAVIIPVYNGECFLPACIDSVQTAGKRVSEIIVVDDGSTDGSLSTAWKLAQDDSRIRVIHTDNHGSYMARRTGIQAANSKYLAFIDVDDRYIHGSLDMLADLLEQNGSDIAMGGLVETSLLDKTDTDYIGTRTPEIRVSATEDMWPRIMKWHTQEFLFYIWHKLYKKELLDELPEMDGVCQGDDVILTCHAFLRAGSIVETAAPVYLYYQNPDGLTHAGFNQTDLDLISVWDEIVRMTEHAKVNVQPDLHYLAQFNRWRVDFTLICRLILSDNKQLDTEYAADLKEWRAALNSHRRQLLQPHALPRSRECLITGLCFAFKPTKWAMRTGRRLMRWKEGYRQIRS